jgi:hypothetical protein
MARQSAACSTRDSPPRSPGRRTCSPWRSEPSPLGRPTPGPSTQARRERSPSRVGDGRPPRDHSATRPSASTTPWSASRSTWARSWVTHSTGTPRAAIARAKSSRRSVAGWSREAVGSSVTSTFGRMSRPRARHKSCASPPRQRACCLVRIVGASPTSASEHGRSLEHHPDRAPQREHVEVAQVTPHNRTTP